MSALGRAKATLETLSTVLVIIAAAGLLWTLFFKQQQTAAGAVPAPPITDVNETIEAKHLANVRGSGPIAIVEFTDFQCPFCARHSKETLPTLRRELIDTGKARYISMHLPLRMHDRAVPAAKAAECAAEQGKFWDMHETLFEIQKEIPTLDFVAVAEKLGMEKGRFERCLSADGERVRAHQKEAERLKVGSTPTLFIGRMRKDGGVDLLKRINGAQPADLMEAEVRKVKG